MRNRQMAEYADGLIVLWDGQSPGTKNMMEEAERHGLRVFLVPRSIAAPTPSTELRSVDGKPLPEWVQHFAQAALDNLRNPENHPHLKKPRRE